MFLEQMSVESRFGTFKAMTFVANFSLFVILFLFFTFFLFSESMSSAF